MDFKRSVENVGFRIIRVDHDESIETLEMK